MTLQETASSLHTNPTIDDEAAKAVPLIDWQDFRSANKEQKKQVMLLLCIGLNLSYTRVADHFREGSRGKISGQLDRLGIKVSAYEGTSLMSCYADQIATLPLAVGEVYRILNETSSLEPMPSIENEAMLPPGVELVKKAAVSKKKIKARGTSVSSGSRSKNSKKSMENNRQSRDLKSFQNHKKSKARSKNYRAKKLLEYEQFNTSLSESKELAVLVKNVNESLSNNCSFVSDRIGIESCRVCLNPKDYYRGEPLNFGLQLRITIRCIGDSKSGKEEVVKLAQLHKALIGLLHQSLQSNGCQNSMFPTLKGYDSISLVAIDRIGRKPLSTFKVAAYGSQA